MHRCRDIKASLKYAGEYLRAGGLLILLETTENTILQHVSTGILEKGFSTVTDERKGTGKPLLTKDQWSDAVLKCGFAKVNTAPNDQLDLPIYNQGVIVALAQPETYAFNSTKLKAYLENMIPSYMIPTAFMEIDKFPLSANGKVDRKALPVPVGETRENAKDQFQEPETAVEKELAAIWKTVLHTENISRNDNYFELGGDSLLATQLNAEINKKFNINLSLEKIFSNPIFAEQAISIASMLEDCEVKNMNAEKLEMVSPKPKEWGEPFPLTDVQQSYWLGRNGGFALGDVSTHCYFEMDCGGLDTDLAEEKWRRLILRHGMMRAVFLNDGQNQKILSNVPEYEIKVYDLASQEETVDEKLESIRKEMAYQIFDTSKWPLFDVRFSKLPGGNVRLHISFDNIIFDGWSMFLILREWKMLYDNPEKEVEPLDLSFRDYVLAYEDIKKTEFYKRDEEYWQKRLPDIFPAPELPVIKENGNTAVQKFIRYESKLTGSQWSAIKNMASQNGLTASGVLMTAYAEVLGRWSKSQKFTINLTRFNRLPIHNQIMDVVGDFTSLTLLSIDNTAGKSFLERCKNLQQQLWSDLAHPYYSGVELEREISKKQEIRNAAIMPIVFTSGLGIKQGGSNEQEEYFGEMVYGLSQTPQVWIDHQVTEQNERLVLTWDAVQDIFPAGVLDEMFAAYISLLEVLSTEQEAWNRESNSLVQIPNMENRELANSVNGKIPDETLISLVEKSMKENPERIAIINNERKLSYGELERYSTGIGHILQRENVERNSLVAIVMEKGWEQIVAAISILKAGAAYLPIDPSFPEERVHLLLKNASVKVVLTQEKVNREVNWPEDTTIICVDGVDVESIDTTDFESIATGNDLAYVIYTSGSTGMPKGVMIEHRAAVNTIIDVNERFAVGKDDKCIALSNLNFDLSVYDIFGLLIAGGTVVIPDAKQVKEPQHWLEIMQENKITVWNSVPAFMQMFMEFLSTKPDTKLPLRVVIMSGDWIPMELPEMIKMHSESVRMISMGGATEASIWSNYYEVESVKDGWTSIPYGKPLTNQKFYVLDQEMNDCPNWVAGRLFIAGEGLARGYWKDRKRTEERFINHPVTHERLYYTGDLGRYWPDGNIEFLGREDTQVKVRGHRIELGEAENVLLTHELIKSAVVVVEEDKSGLAAAVVLNEDSDCCDNKNVEKILHEYLGKKLPEYMVPGKILVMEQLPLSVNGKVDRKALRKILGGYQGQISEEKKKEAPQGELEVKIAAIWERVLGTKEISRDDDFFMCGGDSLKAVKIISELNATEAFSLLIERLCTNLKVWEQVHPVELPLKTGKVRKSVNKTEKDLPDKMLHEGFYNCLQNCPDEIALIAAEGTFSYKELGSYVAGIQNELCKSGFRKGDFVAISADKGMWQIAAVLAVLFSGGVYLPFDVSQPIARQNKILEKSGTKYLITNKKYQSLEWKEHIVVLAAEDINRTEQALTIVEIPLENPAYIIHTSGTTGDPKGVVISHKAAVNTIEDINSRFDINSADRMFGLANLAFDLSVYDIFGAFNAGAALVLPDPEKQKDPYYWVETIKKNEITVWNSVPAQMQMLVSVLESRGVSGDFPLKVVLLSGDWIPVTLPDQIHTSCKKAKVVSLGGATEAAIWSIYHEIEEVPDGAVSIPYGKPLANQKFYVLNEKMEQCPDWVPGDLYIGGKGLALEYLNKPEETNAHFMYDEQLQERIYKTGDIGRYWPDGTIEFMGREDTQVKIHGHRIELSEIESALLSNTLVKTAVAVIVGKRPQDYKIVAFVEGNIEVSELTEYIKTQVPEYMVPSRFEVNEKIPLSANGKVERKALKKLAETYFQNTGKCEMPPHEGLEKEIAELWKTLLKIDRVNRTDNFYDIGGDSLLVAQAVSKTKEAINVAKDVEWDRLMIGMLQNPTIMDFAQFLNSVQIGTSHEENEISETPLNIIADIPEGGEVMKVFFPGGIGFLQQFNTLFQILVNNPERTEGIAAFNYTEDKEYLDSEEKDHIVTIGRRYADLLLNSGYRKFKLIGYCMGGLVAIEAARALLEAGAEVLPVVTIDTIPIVLEMEGDLLMERSYGLMVGADVSKAGHVKRDELVQMALELLKDHNNGFIEEDAILGLTGELPELAACYKKQKTLSKRERMENLKNAIPENSMQLSSEDMNRFDELFEIYKRNYRCAIGYTPKPFAGDLQALSCMDDHSPFVPVMKPGTEAFLSKCALGNLEVLPIGGNHLSCLMTPNVEGMANLLDGKGERV